jgi:hypothetical protein
MTDVKNLKKEIRSKIEIIKKINDEPNQFVTNVYDRYLDDIKSKNLFSGKDIDSIKTTKKGVNNDIFSELLTIISGFISFDESSSNNTKSQEKIQKYAIESAETVIKKSKDIVLEKVKSNFFSGSESVCGIDTEISSDQINLSPKSFDFLNVLTINPNTNTGSVIYENDVDYGDIKMNKEFYKLFSTSPYIFTSNNDTDLFTITWNDVTQEYEITNLKQGSTVKIGDFFNDYYSSIELPNIDIILKTAMTMVLHGDNSTTKQFSISLNNLNRLTDKLFSICGNPTNDSLKQTTNELFNENDDDISEYFNFDVVEGIDLDQEKDRLDKVLRFTDCGNYTIPTNQDIFEDFTFLTKNKITTENITDTLKSISKDTYNDNDSIPIINFQISLFNSFITQVPKALISSVLSPKMLFPISLMFKDLKGLVLDSQELMSSLSNLFYDIIRTLFWDFIRVFWSKVKKDLIRFISEISVKILTNKYKRYLSIVKGLIELIRNLLNVKIGSCTDLFGSILSLINGSLSTTGPSVNVPGILLGFSDYLPGYSQDRAYMNISERLQSYGIDLNPINGEPNDLTNMVKSIIDGNIEEMDKNSYFKGSNKEIVLGGIVIPPGVINVSGKMF